MTYFFIFIISILVCTVVLLCERAVGINWDFHPDAVTYISAYNDVVSSSLLALPNQLYFYIAWIAKGNISYLISLNILAYSITNIIFYREYSRFSKAFNKKSLFFLSLLIFAPYRTHLAVNVLKDTLIILALTLIIAGKKIRLNTISILSFLFLMRIYSLLYLLLLARIRILLLLLLILCILMTLFDIPWVDFILDRNFANMRSREFDTISSFSDFGFIGTLSRMLVWPALLVSGFFILLAPSLMLAPISFEIIAFRVWSWKFLRSTGVNLNLFICLAIISALVDSFAAFLRYAYPLLVVMPIILMQKRINLFSGTNKLE